MVSIGNPATLPVRCFQMMFGVTRMTGMNLLTGDG
jgi:hypothetical protein